MRSPTRSTPFPTRRSSDLIGTFGAGSVSAETGSRAARERVGTRGEKGGLTENPCAPRVIRSAAPSAPVESTSSADRKSTRLNSSHLGISYAVFCLKKNTYEPESFDMNVPRIGTTIFDGSIAGFANLRREAKPEAAPNTIAWASRDDNSLTTWSGDR